MIGIDISPTACRVMAKRLRDVCALPESEPLWPVRPGSYNDIRLVTLLQALVPVLPPKARTRRL
jgi:hypothetical protein